MEKESKLKSEGPAATITPKNDESADSKKVSFKKMQRRRPPLELTFDYKDVGLLNKFVTEHGRIVPCRISRLNPYQQRQLTRAVKQARTLALVAYSGE